MRPSLPPHACAALILCLLSFVISGCAGGSPFASVGSLSTHSTTLSTDATPPRPVQQSQVSVVISDPAACRAPNGTFQHIYVTVADVQGSTDPNAPAGDRSFVNLTPGLATAPKQVDLLGQASSHCFLASLGALSSVDAGDYRQLRIVLVADSAASTIAHNACGASFANCVVNSDNGLHDLHISAEAVHGIEVGVDRIANGSLAVDANDQPTIDLNFDICSSILLTANGGYELRPMVHAGLVASQGGTISGSIVSSATGKALAGGSVMVALEQKSSTGVDHILMQTAANPDGSFILCPVPQGTYDIVAVGMDGANTAYSVGMETGIQAGQIAGQIPLIPGTAQGILKGTITAQRSTRPAVGALAAMRADALLQVANDGPTITVPLLPSQSPYNEAMLTQNLPNCPAGTDCSQFSMMLPTIAPNVLACSSETTGFHQQPEMPAQYMAEAFAQIPGSGGVPDCLVSKKSVTTTRNGAALELHPGQSSTTAILQFTQCE